MLLMMVTATMAFHGDDDYCDADGTPTRQYLDGDGSSDIKDDMPFVMTLMLWLLMMLLVLSLLW